MDINQYISLFLEEKKEEMEKFKNYTKTSVFLKKNISYNEWKYTYLNWVPKQEGSLKKSEKILDIYLSED